MNIRILCLHDHTAAVEQLRRLLLEKHPDWRLERVSTQAEASRAMLTSAPEVIIAVQTPTIDGRAALTEIRDRRGDTVRLLLAGHEIDEATLRSLKIAHRVLPLDASPDVILEALERSLLMHEIVSNAPLRAMLGRIGSLPPAPSVYSDLTMRLADPSVSVTQLADIVSEDPSLAAEVLRLANSAFFGRDLSVGSLSIAAARLGTRLLRSVVLAAEMRGRFPLPSPELANQLEAKQRHASLVARIASSLEPRARWSEDAFTAGLLHDVGEMVLASWMPAEWSEIQALARRERLPRTEAERARLGVDHAAVGACVLGLWGLPPAVVEAVLRHHTQPLDGSITLSPRVAVALADRLAYEVDESTEGPVTSAEPVGNVALEPRWPWWREMAGQLARECLAT